MFPVLKRSLECRKEEMMKNLKTYIVTTCISFTTVLLIESFLELQNGLSTIDIELIYYIFIVNILVNFSIFIIDLFTTNNVVIKTILHILAINIVVFYMNYAYFNAKNVTFNYDFGNVSFTIIFLIITYFIVIFLLNVHAANHINKQLKERHIKNDGSTN